MGIWAAGVLVLCVVVSGVAVTQLYVPLRMKGSVVAPWPIIRDELVEWVLWGLAVPLMLLLDRRYGFRSRRWPSALALHVTFGLAFILLHNGAIAALGRLSPEPGFADMSFQQAYIFRLSAKLPGAILVYATVLTVAHVVQLRNDAHRRESELARANLSNLQMQMQPHFLFNALHTVAGEVRAGRNAVAVNMIGRLSELLRHALDREPRHEATLGEELRFVGAYLDIQRVRFGDRLHVTIDVPSALHEAIVPNFMLQPLVENAIHYGVDQHSGKVDVRVRARASDGWLTVRVEDCGPGFPQSLWTEGVGLSATRERLRQLYGSRQRFSATSRPGGGAAVEIGMVLRGTTECSA